ncbi:hypothetical protein ACFQX6_38960 [Streptosporangium lutulentum]
MALNFDARKAPRNHAELEKLVQAVRQASKADETIWLEWKSELDLNPADKGDKSGRAHVARAIIGFANRMPEDAARFAEGYGFLLAGVSHDSMAAFASTTSPSWFAGSAPMSARPSTGSRPTSKATGTTGR